MNDRVGTKLMHGSAGPDRYLAVSSLSSIYVNDPGARVKRCTNSRDVIELPNEQSDYGSAPLGCTKLSSDGVVMVLRPVQEDYACCTHRSPRSKMCALDVENLLESGIRRRGPIKISNTNRFARWWDADLLSGRRCPRRRGLSRHSQI